MEEIMQTVLRAHTQPAPYFPPPVWPQLHLVTEKRVNVLLAEDKYADEQLTRIALQVAQVPCTLSSLRRGDELLNRLRFHDATRTESAPDLILLDLGLPGRDGFEVLAELSQMSPYIRAIPIVILTGYRNFQYIREIYQLCIVDYIDKPCSPAELETVLRQVYANKAD